MTLDEAGAAIAAVRQSVGSVVIGQDDAIEQALVAFLASGHALLEGVPGTAKTLLVRALAHALGARFGRIQFTPDLMPSDVTGVSVFREEANAFEFRPGPVFTDFLLADEINRAPAKTQAALLEAMQEGQVTVDGASHPLSDGFAVFATQNPVEHEGTYHLPEAQLDRFLLKIRIGYPSEQAELRMLEQHAAGFRPERLAGHMPPAVLDEAGARDARALVSRVTVAADVRAYLAAIVRATRDEPGFLLGGSPRAAVALQQAARAAALVSGRDFVTPDDVKRFALPVLRHRVILAAELEVEGRTSDDALGAVLARVPVPA